MSGPTGKGARDSQSGQDVEKWRRASQSHPAVRVGGRLTRVQVAANGRAATRPLFSSRSGVVEEPVRRARRQRSHRWTTRGKARPKPVHLGERRDAGWEKPGAGPYSPGPGRSGGRRDGRPGPVGGYTRRPAHVLAPGWECRLRTGWSLVGARRCPPEGGDR